MPDPRLELQPVKVRDLVADYRAGKLVIPEFQREYVWRKNRAPKLVDSLYRGYPVSVLLLWNTEENPRARRKDPRPSRAGLLSWLIDGQQRVITLSRVLAGDEGIEVVFHPDRDLFKLANAATSRDVKWYRVSDLLDDESFRQVRRGLPENNAGRAREAAFERVRRILDFEIPAIKMLDHSFDAAVDAFIRINTHGTKLKRQDIESARVAARHTGFIADEVAPYLTELRQQGYSRFNVMHLFRACAFAARPDGRMRTPLHELERSEVQAAWNTTKRAVSDTLALVRNEFGLVNMDILWSGALLVPVIAYHIATTPRERDTRGIAGWLAMAALLHRYSGASETALDQDLRACRESDPVGRLLSNLRKDSGWIGSEPDDFEGALMDKGALFASYVACRHRGLKDLFSGSPIMLQKNIDRHHILPRAQFRADRQSAADTIANVAFINGGTNRSIGAASPEVYLAEVAPDVLNSQCIPPSRRLWRIDRAEEFWTARRDLLAEAFNDALKALLPSRRIGSPR